MAAPARRSPFRELEAIEQRLRRVLDESRLPSFASESVPAADVYEREGEYVVELEAPGFREDQLHVELADRMLSIRGECEESREEGEEGDAAFHVKERLVRRFERRFALPPDVDTERLEARYENGVLVIRAPKGAGGEPRRIEIGA